MSNSTSSSWPLRKLFAVSRINERKIFLINLTIIRAHSPNSRENILSLIRWLSSINRNKSHEQQTLNIATEPSRLSTLDTFNPFLSENYLLMLIAQTLPVIVYLIFSFSIQWNFLLRYHRHTHNPNNNKPKSELNAAGCWVMMMMMRKKMKRKREQINTHLTSSNHLKAK